MMRLMSLAFIACSVVSHMVRITKSQANAAECVTPRYSETFFSIDARQGGVNAFNMNLNTVNRKRTSFLLFGRPIDFSKATVHSMLSETEKTIVYAPAEVNDAKITLLKKDNRVLRVEYKGRLVRSKVAIYKDDHSVEDTHHIYD